MKLTRSEIAQVALEAAVCPRTVVDFLGGLNTQPAGRRRIEAVLARRGLRAREPLVRTSAPVIAVEAATAL
jgi:hypothetical protein